jgi:hypothetical protein
LNEHEVLVLSGDGHGFPFGQRKQRIAHRDGRNLYRRRGGHDHRGVQSRPENESVARGGAQQDESYEGGDAALPSMSGIALAGKQSASQQEHAQHSKE